MTPARCEIHKDPWHRPRVSVADVHHVWPRGDGGPDIPENRVTLCVQSHRNVHELLNRYREAKGMPAREVLRGFSTKERALAATGWDRMQRKAM